MKAKALALVEKHVEKIVLAVALAGAGFIAWSGMQPITVPDAPEPITATEVEPKVTEAVTQLNKVREDTAAIPIAKLTPSLQNYVADYERLMLRQPLPSALVSTTAIPRFAPLQEPVVGGGPEGVMVDTRIVTPTVPDPTDVTAVADRGSVIPPPLDPTQAAAEQPGTAAPPQSIDKSWVCISGNIPWKKYLDSLNDPKLKEGYQKLSPENQRAVLYRVDVERRTRIPGGWSAWEKVPPTKAGGDPVPEVNWDALSDTDLLTTVSALDANLARIAEPLFYYFVPKDPTLPPQPIVAPIAKTTTTQPSLTAARPALPPPGAGAPAPSPVDNPDAVAPPPTPAVMADPTTLKAQPSIPFWFYDETVDASHDYQYRARIEMYNPVYHYPGGLADPKMKNQPILASAWVTPAPTTVSVGGDLYFFVNAPIGNGNAVPEKVNFSVLKWTNGGWYRTEWNEEPGMQLSGPLRIVDKNTTINIDTGYTLIDIQSASNGDINVILLTPTGELITHNSKADAAIDGSERKTLSEQVVKIKPKPPAAPPGGTVNNSTTGGVPNPQRNGRNGSNPDDQNQ